MTTTAAALTAGDRLAIAELLAKYSWAFDTSDADAFAATFAPDASYELVSGRRCVGREEIRQFCVEAGRRPGFFGRQHHTDQLLIEGDGERCEVRSYSFGPFRHPDGRCDVFWLGHYTDICVKIDGHWLFQERVVRRWDGPVLERFGHV